MTAKRVWMRGRKCTVLGCDEPHAAKGYCRIHYKMWARHGDPLAAPKCVANGTHRTFILETAVPFSKSDCLIWPFGSKTHPVVWWGGVSDRAHRIVCELAHGKAPDARPFALHMCGNARCVNPKHLYWGSQKSNMQDAIRHGRTTRGEKNASSVLSELEVRTIRRLGRKLTQQTLAEQFGVSQVTINNILSRVTWYWLE